VAACKTIGVSRRRYQSKEETMSKAPVSAREAVRGVVPRMIELSETVIYGDIWERPGLSKRDRSLMVIAALIASYRPEQLVGHLNRGLDNGLTKEEISEMITHLAFYSGWPGSMTAARIFKEVLDQRGIA
jgi:4-carboxymuconolactone decarboxylase